jgi:hypothetical protein
MDVELVDKRMNGFTTTIQVKNPRGKPRGFFTERITVQTLPNVNPKHFCLEVTVPIFFYTPCGYLKELNP